MAEGDRGTDAESSVPALWQELGRIRKEKGLSFGQLHQKIGGDERIKRGTLCDRLKNGRQTSWEEMRHIVIALGCDECEWKERFDSALRRNGKRWVRHSKDSSDSDTQGVTSSWWAGRRAKLAVGLAFVGAACLTLVFVWVGLPSHSGQVRNVRCARVSDGTVRLYDEPGNRKHSFVKYEGERIQFPIPNEDVTGSDGLRYRRVLTPSRRDGYGWIRSDVPNLVHLC